MFSELYEPGEVGVKFKEEKGLGVFCQYLRQYRIPYVLAGHNTVVIDAIDLQRLKEDKIRVLTDFKPDEYTVVSFAEASKDAQEQMVAQRLLPRARALQNIRARLDKK